MARDPYIVTVRAGPKVRRERRPTLEAALDRLEERARDLAATTRRPEVDLKVRHFAPIAQVAARAEVSGPGRWRPAIRAGVDIRGDGSIEAYTGGVNREVVVTSGDETPYAALRRTLLSRRERP